MKKLFALILAVMMIATLSVTAFAAELPAESVNGDKSKDVTAKYVAGTEATAVYMVDIEWGAMEFTYTAASEGTWDPESHTYDGVSEAKWSYADGANKVTVTNHSNAKVSVAIANSDVTDGITFTWDKETFELASADNGLGENGAGKPVSDSAALTVSGTLAETENAVKIGTITVTISDVESVVE